MAKANGYDQAMGLLIKTMGTAKRTIANSDFVPALMDFTTLVGLAADGEPGVRAMIAGMEQRVRDWHEGGFGDPPGPGKKAQKGKSKTVVAFLKAAAEHEPGIENLLERLEPATREYVDFFNASPNAAMEMDEGTRTKAYAEMEDILAETMRRVTEAGLPLPVLLFSFADFLALVTLRLTGDDTILRMQIERLELKISEWHKGEFGV